MVRGVSVKMSDRKIMSNLNTQENCLESQEKYLLSFDIRDRFCKKTSSM